MTDLLDIGFYTLSDHRASQCSHTSPLWRCELIVTTKCNLSCPYCRPLRKEAQGELTLNQAISILDKWIRQGLKNVRFSGGEPTLWPPLAQCVRMCRGRGVERVAVSTNGTADWDVYERLLDCGVDDFSISLDADCCAAGSQMNGGYREQWKRSVETIRRISKLSYTTVGMVLTDDNLSHVNETVRFAHDLGVHDIRVIPAAQNGAMLSNVRIANDVLRAHPILKYRYGHMRSGISVRGLSDHDAPSCHLAIDDMVVAGEYHWPCIIYLREGGPPVGRFGKNFRRHRRRWSEYHDPRLDPICRVNCLDVCRDYNNRVQRYMESTP